MSALTEIRHHIRVVEDTRKITRAMYLISSAKMKRAMRQHDQNALSFERIRSEIRFILESIHVPTRNPFFRPHGDKTAYLVIAGDKGLCGGYNHEILKLADSVINKTPPEDRSLFTIGHMASEYFERRGQHPDVHYLHVIQDPSLRHARAITSELCWLFTQHILDNVYVIYTQLDSKGSLHATSRRLLPILKEDFADAAETDEPVRVLAYHPSRFEALDTMVTHYLIGWIYSALVQANASEHHARMNAMYSATNNADDMLSRLNIQWGHARQQAITQELTEIIAGSGAGADYL
ncbi:MAG: ATP synthase F1 subunit gamma [Oscillospiraceae bacterium]|jgi:F-type H+-transporting ATPase subunit gamma|nr:ATP synthase F1 subunit gamma [Oscillospiraceae bacterium]